MLFCGVILINDFCGVISQHATLIRRLRKPMFRECETLIIVRNTQKERAWNVDGKNNIDDNKIQISFNFYKTNSVLIGLPRFFCCLSIHRCLASQLLPFGVPRWKACYCSRAVFEYNCRLRVGGTRLIVVARKETLRTFRRVNISVRMSGHLARPHVWFFDWTFHLAYRLRDQTA